MTVIIGIDPHKASHTAVAIGGDEQKLAEVKVRATCQQTAKLLAWAEPLGERTWAVESAGGMGYPLAQQLVGPVELENDIVTMRKRLDEEGLDAGPLTIRYRLQQRHGKAPGRSTIGCSCAGVSSPPSPRSAQGLLGPV